jgi:predicted aspartyl protease
MLFAALLTSSCGSNCLRLGTAGSVCGAREATMPILEDGNGMPIVAGALDGAAIRLLIDSGASRTILSATLLGTPGEANHVVKSLCVGSLCLDDTTVWARDSGFSAPEAGAINGIVGMDVLRAFLVEIDNGRSVRLSPSAAACAGDTVAISFDDYGRPLVAADVDGERLGAILIDTGALYSLLSSASAAKFSYLADRAVAATGCGINGCTNDQFISQAHRMCVGTTCMDNVPVKYPVWDAVGDSFLFQHRVDIDFPGRKVVFCSP